MAFLTNKYILEKEEVFFVLNEQYIHDFFHKIILCCVFLGKMANENRLIKKVVVASILSFIKYFG